jgi:hypothetical protein
MASTIPFALLLLASREPVSGQEELTLPELEAEYRVALADYDAAFQRFEILSDQIDAAQRDFASATAAGDEVAQREAYERTFQIAGERRLAQRRVENEVAELREIRERLLNATAARLTELLAVADTATDPLNQEDLRAFVNDTGNRLAELRNLEDPPVTLEPEPDINIEPRDGPERLRQKATLLEFTATQYSELFAYNERQLEGLRRDQALLRRSGDFLADFTRFDDPNLPVGTPANRNVTLRSQREELPLIADSSGVSGVPLTLEQRIEALEALQEEITERIQNVLTRAQIFRRRAGGGEWAW